MHAFLPEEEEDPGGYGEVDRDSDVAGGDLRGDMDACLGWDGGWLGGEEGDRLGGCRSLYGPGEEDVMGSSRRGHLLRKASDERRARRRNRQGVGRE